MLKRNALMLSLAVCAATILIGSEANAGWRARTDRNAQKMASQYPWHSEYAHTAYGRPLALVVPPTAATSTEWGWGVTQSEVRPIYHQYKRPYPGGGEESPHYFEHTPPWPSHTRQFGVQYIRGPW